MTLSFGDYEIDVERRELRRAKPHRLGGSPQGTRLRVRQDQCVPTCLILAPCSGPSRHGLETLAQVANSSRRPALTAPARGAPAYPQAGTKERPLGTNKGTARSKEVIVSSHPLADLGRVKLAELCHSALRATKRLMRCTNFEKKNGTPSMALTCQWRSPHSINSGHWQILFQCRAAVTPFRRPSKAIRSAT
jgi:hypothetical protein